MWTAGQSRGRTILWPSAPAAKRDARPSRKAAMTSCSRAALTASGTSSGRWRAAWVLSRSLRAGREHLSQIGNFSREPLHRRHYTLHERQLALRSLALISREKLSMYRSLDRGG